RIRRNTRRMMSRIRILTVERKRIDPNRLYGVVVGQSDTLMLLHEEYEFQFNGYCVVRRNDVTESFTSESNDYAATLMKKEGLWEQAPRHIQRLPLDSWYSLLSEFVGQVIILEDERTEDFYIGPVEEITKSGVVVRHFDGCGEWTGKKSVAFLNITFMKFGDRYSTIHAKYLKE
ncbi:MAG: hypothetical protein ACRES9_05960, partial [Gammaproteobacteria bacterium]